MRQSCVRPDTPPKALLHAPYCMLAGENIGCRFRRWPDVPIFVRNGSGLSRTDGYPPHADRFAHAGYDLSRLLGHGNDGEQEGAA
jgi:hypothetical protein